MSEPEKKPEQVEPAIGATPSDAHETPHSEPAAHDAGDITVPAAVNNNEAVAKPVKADPVVTVVPAAEVTKPAANANEPVTPKAPEAPVAAAAPVATTPAAPAAETPAAAETAAPATDTPAAPAQPGRGKRFLKVAFNMAVSMGLGMGVSFAAKSVAIMGLSMAGAPALATMLVSGLVVGTAMTVLADVRNRSAEKKAGKQLSGFFSKAHAKEFFTSKKNLKTFAISTTSAIVGSAVILGLHNGFFEGVWNHLTGHVPAAAVPVPAVVAPIVAPPVEHVVPVAPPVEHVVAAPPPVVVPVHCLTPTEQFADLVKGHHVSAQVTDALHRSASSNAHVAAQGTKDLAFYAQNGMGGVPKDTNTALALFKQAADAGNVQAKVDMLYLQHYGLDHVVANKAASLSTMHDIHTAKAGEFVKAWGGAGKAAALPHVDFDSNTILKGAPLLCPAV